MLKIIRGPAGCGKSTAAAEYVKKGFAHYENDMYCMRNGKYIYEESRAAEASDWCFNNVEKDLMAGKDVVVSNTFIRISRLRPYLDLAHRLNVDLEIINKTECYGSIHGVPKETMVRQITEFEPYYTSDYIREYKRNKL